MHRPWLSTMRDRKMNQMWVLPTKTFVSNEKEIDRRYKVSNCRVMCYSKGETISFKFKVG